MSNLKICIFCGKAPKTRTDEHVLPRWLLQLTGNEKRQAFLGRDWRSAGFPDRTYAFSSFVSPACDVCNTRYGTELEGAARAVLTKMVALEAVSSKEFETLLDWLDKVRIGIWLGLRLLSGNVAGINPKFHIDQRLGCKDRVVYIQRLPLPEKRLTLYGVDTPIFRLHPAFYAIRINGLLLVNASCDYLISRQFGLPSPRGDGEEAHGGLTRYKLSRGTHAFEYPVRPFELPGLGTWLYQPIEKFVNMPGAMVTALYQNQWAKSLGLDLSSGRCNLFFENDYFDGDYRDTPWAYPSAASSAWVPRPADDSQPGNPDEIGPSILVGQWMVYDFYGRTKGEKQKSGDAVGMLQRSILQLARQNPSAFTTSVELGDT